MDPENGCPTYSATPVVFAQLTVRSGLTFSGSISVQGKGSGADDWTILGMDFSNVAAPPPPPPPPPRITGCTNQLAVNYNPRATSDDGSCRLPPPPPPPPVYGCMTLMALNYNPQATVDDGSCRMPPPPPPPPSPSGGPVLQVVQTSTAKVGYTTYQVSVNFGPAVQDVYALFGEAGALLNIPPAFQQAAPFGTDVGPVRQVSSRLIAICLVRSLDRCA